jgi:hypothetical protein
MSHHTQLELGNFYLAVIACIFKMLTAYSSVIKGEFWAEFVQLT